MKERINAFGAKERVEHYTTQTKPYFEIGDLVEYTYENVLCIVIARQWSTIRFRWNYLVVRQDTMNEMAIEEHRLKAT